MHSLLRNNSTKMQAKKKTYIGVPKLFANSGKLIWWLINCQGGSFGGTPPTRSVILSIHRSLSSGSDPRVFLPLGFTAAAELMSDLPPCVPRCLAACEAASWLHSGGFGHGFGGLLVTIHCTSSDDSDGMFIGTMYYLCVLHPGL